MDSPKWILRSFSVQYPVPCGTKQLSLTFNSRLWIEEDLTLDSDELVRLHNFMSLCRENKSDAENSLLHNRLAVNILGNFTPVGFKRVFEKFYFDPRLPSYWNRVNGRSFSLFSAWEVLHNTPLKELTVAARFLCRWVIWLLISVSICLFSLL